MREGVALRVGTSPATPLHRARGVLPSTSTPAAVYRVGALKATRQAGFAVHTTAPGGRGEGEGLAVGEGVREKEGVGVAEAPGLGTVGRVEERFLAPGASREAGADQRRSKARADTTPPS